MTLSNRAFEVERLEIPAGDPQSELVRRLVATAERDPELRPSSHVLNELAGHYGFSSVEALEIERRLAATAIRRNAFVAGATADRVRAARRAAT